MVSGWHFLDRFEIDEFLDKMDEAGVRHLAFSGALPIRPDSKCYEDSVVKPEEPTPETMSRELPVRSLIRSAKDRGLGVFLYGTNPHAGGATKVYTQLPCKQVVHADGSVRAVDSYWGACANAPEFLAYYLGRISDAQRSFPEVDGLLNDGPEFGYEISPDLMGDNWSVFSCFGPCCERRARDLGYDFEALRGAAIALQRGLRSLEAEALEQVIASHAAPGEALAAVAGEPAVVEWLDFKRDSITAYIGDLCEGVRNVAGALEIGIGSRLPAFAPLTGYDLSRLAEHADFLLPKIYLWMGGYDGLYGTAYRWVKTLKQWNAHLSEDLLFQFVYELFGFTLPGVGRLEDMTRYIAAEHLDAAKVEDVTRVTRLGEPFPEQFFTDVVTTQVQKMIEQVGDARRVRPWVGTSHGGRALTPRELDLLLSAGASGGLTTYLYYCPLETEAWALAIKHAQVG